jgi:hypothetical protein
MRNGQAQLDISCPARNRGGARARALQLLLERVGQGLWVDTQDDDIRSGWRWCRVARGVGVWKGGLQRRRTAV